MVPDAALGLIARKATGSFRDALGTLEQLVTYGGKEIRLEDVLENLGVADAELILDAAETLADGDPRAALLAVGRLSESGRDETQFMRDLAAHLRHLFVVQTLGEVPDSFAVTAEHTDRLAAQAERLSQGQIIRAIDLLGAAVAAVKEGSEPRLQLEVALLKATQPQADQTLQALMFRIDQLEARLEGGGLSAGEADGPQARDAPGAAPSQPGSDAVSRRVHEQAAARQASGGAAAVSAGPSGAGAAAAAAAVQPEPTGEEQVVPEPAVEQVAAGETAVLDLEQVKALWSAVADAVREQNAMVGALLTESVPVSLTDGALVVSFPEGAAFSKKKAEANLDLLRTALRSITGRGLAVTFELTAKRDDAPPVRLGEEELLERLKRDFDAEAVFADDDPDTEG